MPSPDLLPTTAFPPVDRDAWLALVDGVLKGGSFDRLRSSTYDGIDIEPLYDAAVPATSDGPLLGRPRLGWDICCEHVEGDPNRANAAILADLEGGATSVRVATPADAGTDWLDTALEGVQLDIAAVRLWPAGDPAALAKPWLAVLDRFGATAGGSLGSDPLGNALRAGGDTAGVEAQIAAVASLNPPAGATLFSIDTAPVVDAGASEGQELAYALGAAVAALRALTDAGTDVAGAAGRIELVLAADSDVFATIAKLRAARRCWSHLLEAAGANGASVHITARNADRVLSRRDPWVNLLRGTAACVGAAIGGADAVIVSPFDAVAGQPEQLGVRMARNTQLLLLEESHLGAVVDPAAGSGYVEALTDAMCAAAWERFVAVESLGGVVSAAAAGTLADGLATTAATRRSNVARRRDPLTGVSEFPNLAEPPLVRGTSGVATVAVESPERRRRIDALPSHHLDDDFEALRAAADAETTRSGTRPRLLLACLGPVAAHTARASWARNLVEAGGIEPIDSEPLSTDAEAAASLEASGCTVAILCGDDGTSADRAAATATALRQAGALHVHIAGRLEIEGVERSLRAGMDVVDALRGLHEELGIVAGVHQ